MDLLKNIDKKTLKIGIIGMSALIGLIILVSVITRLTDKTYYSYSEVEEKLVAAAQNYYNINSSYLPKTEKTTSVVSISTLVNNDYIKPLDTLLKDGENCTAQVVVSKVGSNYEYTPYLDCGSAYSSIELYSKLLEDNQVATEGIGLYKINAEYVFKGEVKNNFILLNEKPWRILRIDEDNNLVLLSQFNTLTSSWDNRYNEETNGNYGINNYNISRIKERLETEYNGTELLTDSEKSKVVSTKWCIGKRLSTDTGNMEAVECRVMSEEESPIGLLTLYEYMQVSLDEGCKTIEDRNCTNYNFIHDFENTFWSITPSPTNTSYAYYITTSGVYESRTNVNRQLRYVIKLGTKAIYSSGSGTEEDPYKIR